MIEVDELRALGVDALREGRHQARIPLLMAALRQKNGALPDGRVPDALRQLMSSAISRLATEAERGAATALFGIRRGAHTSLAKRTEDAYHAYHGEWRSYNTVRTQKAHDRNIVIEVASVLERLLRPGEEQAATKAPSDTYIPRPELEGECLRVLVGTKRLLLFGEPGAGKARLAREVASKAVRIGGVVVEIHAGDERQLLEDLVILLDKDMISTAYAISRFRDYMASTGAPAAVILRDLRDPDLAERLVPPSAPSMVVVTTVASDFQLQTWESVRVGALSEAQGINLAMKAHDGLDADGARTLVTMLGGNPLAIAHACRYLRAANSIDLRSFLGALRADAAAAMDLPGVRRSLTKVYLLMLDTLSSDAMALLDLIVATQWASVSPNSVDRLWRYLHPDQADGLQRIAQQRAAVDLKECGLIHEERREGLPGSIFDVHPLTLQIMSSFRREAGIELRTRLLKAFTASDLATWSWGHALPVAQLAAVGTALRAVSNPDDVDGLEEATAVALALRHATQFAVPNDASATRGSALLVKELSSAGSGSAAGFQHLAGELVSYSCERSSERQPEGVSGAVDAIRAWNSGLLPVVRAFQGNEWFPPQVLGVDWESMNQLADELIAYYISQGASKTDASPNARMELARWFFVKGNMLFEGAKWDEAEKHLSVAQATYQRVTANGFGYTEAVNCARRVGETWLKTGKYSQAKRSLQLDWSVIKDAHPHEELADVFLQHRFTQVLADAERSIAARKGGEDSGFDIANELERLQQHVKMTLSSGRETLVPSSVYSRGCMLALNDLEAAAWVLKKGAEWCTERKWWYAADRFTLAYLKVLSAQDPSAIASCAGQVLALAARFRDQHKSIFWRADALATATTLAIVSGSPFPWLQQVRDEASAACDAVLRPDKLALVDAAADSGRIAIALLAE